jgi:hypothetical protein
MFLRSAKVAETSASMFLRSAKVTEHSASIFLHCMRILLNIFMILSFKKRRQKYENYLIEQKKLFFLKFFLSH